MVCFFFKWESCANQPLKLLLEIFYKTESWSCFSSASNRQRDVIRRLEADGELDEHAHPSPLQSAPGTTQPSDSELWWNRSCAESWEERQVWGFLPCLEAKILWCHGGPLGCPWWGWPSLADPRRAEVEVFRWPDFISVWVIERKPSVPLLRPRGVGASP